MKYAILVIIVGVLGLVLDHCRVWPFNDGSTIESRTCPVDTLVVIQHIDTFPQPKDWSDTTHATYLSGRLYRGVLITGQSIQREPLFANGKHRDTVFESKIVFDK